MSILMLNQALKNAYSYLMIKVYGMVNVRLNVNLLQFSVMLNAHGACSVKDRDF